MNHLLKLIFYQIPQANQLVTNHKISDDWYIFHSLNWKDRSKNGRITWGEADFVIFNKMYGILVVEVKSGGISFKDGKWYQTRIDNKALGIKLKLG